MWANDRVDALLNLIGLSAFTQAYPSQLSGGMQQRVAIERALMPKPPIRLRNEPFGSREQLTRTVQHEGQRPQG